jgi:hypothetical protein
MGKKVSAIAAELADREGIRDCLYRFCRGVDRVDVDLILSAFWPDATDEHGNFEANSAQDFVDHALPVLQSMDLTTHDLGNILIDIEGDTAFVESYVRAYHRMRRPNGERYDHISSSRYLDRMERRDGEWRIKHRTVVRDWFREFPDSAAWAEGALPQALGYGKRNPIELGKRKPDDLSYALLNHPQT